METILGLIVGRLSWSVFRHVPLGLRDASHRGNVLGFARVKI